MATPVDMSGGCLCGAIRYRIVGAPVFVGQCYCKDCRKATGTGHTTVLGVPEVNLRIEGEPEVYTSRGESGGQVRRHFCSVCAGRLYTSADSAGPIRMVQAGSLDEPDAVTPTVAIYVKDALTWDRIDPALAKFDRVPPSP
ncbi:MAG: GFA family protein [Steroidobacteraceae bacterium]